MLTLYHNPRCSKSRQALALLTDRGMTPEIIRYLDTPPDAATLRDLLAILDLPARGLLRAKEARARELNLSDADEETIITAMAAHPVLIERPILITEKGAVIGRPPEAILDLL